MYLRAALLWMSLAVGACSSNAPTPHDTPPTPPLNDEADDDPPCDLQHGLEASNDSREHSIRQLLLDLQNNCTGPAESPTRDAVVYVQRSFKPWLPDEHTRAVQAGQRAIADRCGGTLPPHEGPPPAVCKVPPWIMANGNWSHAMVAAAMVYDLNLKRGGDAWGRRFADLVVNEVQDEQLFAAGLIPHLQGTTAIVSHAVHYAPDITSSVIVDLNNELLPSPVGTTTRDPVALTPDGPTSRGQRKDGSSSALVVNVTPNTRLRELEPLVDRFENVIYLIAYNPDPKQAGNIATIKADSLVTNLKGPSRAVTTSIAWVRKEQRPFSWYLRLSADGSVGVYDLDDVESASFNLSDPEITTKLPAKLCERTFVRGTYADGDVTLGQLTKLRGLFYANPDVEPSELCLLHFQNLPVEVADGRKSRRSNPTP